MTPSPLACTSKPSRASSSTSSFSRIWSSSSLATLLYYDRKTHQHTNCRYNMLKCTQSDGNSNEKFRWAIASIYMCDTNAMLQVINVYRAIASIYMCDTNAMLQVINVLFNPACTCARIQAIDRHLIFSHSTRNHHGADSTHTCTEKVREHIVPGWSPTRSLTLSTLSMRNEPCIFY